MLRTLMLLSLIVWIGGIIFLCARPAPMLFLILPTTRMAGIFIRDGHAGQGNGEVDITALETSLIGKLQFK